MRRSTAIRLGGAAPEEPRLQETALVDLVNVALRAGNEADVGQAVVERVRNALSASHVEAMRLDDSGHVLEVKSAAGDLAGQQVGQSCNADSTEMPGLSVVAREPIWTADFKKEKRFSIPTHLRGLGLRAGLCVEIVGDAAPYGALAAYYRAPRVFTAKEIQFLRAAGNVLALSFIEKRSLEARGESEAKLRAIVDAAVDAILTIDEQGGIQWANAATQRIFGYTFGELAGRNIRMLMPEPYASAHDGYLRAYLRTGQARIIGIGREVIGLHKNGATFPIDLAVSEFRLGDRRHFTGIIRDISYRRRLEQQILDATTEEQRRIGQDLHDGLCQQLTAVAFAIESLAKRADARQAEPIRRIGSLVDDSITQARRLAPGLQPVTLEGEGLVSALRGLAEQTAEAFDVDCRFESSRGLRFTDSAAATHLYRIAQEAINNAIRHGQAHNIIIRLSEQSQMLELSIIDDGIGISTLPGQSQGMGLHTMSYRARMIGGTLDIQPGKRGGTSVTCRFPNMATMNRQESDHEVKAVKRSGNKTRAGRR